MKITHYSDKYKTLLINVILILIVILLLVVNAFTFNALIKNTEKIHQSNYLGILSQQITKTMITLRDEKVNNINTQSSISQLNENIDFFHQNINNLSKSNNDDRFDIFRSVETKDKIIKIQKEWESWEPDLKLLIKNNANEIDEINYLINKLNAKNIYLLSLTEDHSLALKTNAAKYNQVINNIQVTIFLLFVTGIIFFGRRYKIKLDEKHDEKIHQKMIIQALNENVFLLSCDGKILQNHYAAKSNLMQIINVKEKAFSAMFKNILTESVTKEFNIYFQYISNNVLDVSTIKKLNPIYHINTSNNLLSCHLQNTFTQVVVNNKVVAVVARIEDLKQLE